MLDVAFVIPGDLMLPTGGYAYDRRVLALFRDFGIAARHVALPGSYPSPTPADVDMTEQTLAGLPSRTMLFVDGLAYGAMPASLVRSVRQPIVALVHHPLCLEAGLTPDAADALRFSEREALAHARHVVVTSAATRQTVVRLFNIAADKITVAEPGTDAAARAVGSAKGLDAPLELLAVGSVVARKGYDVLIQSLALLAGQAWRLTIAGAERDAAAVAALDTALRETDLGARVRRLGAVSTADLDHLYAQADVFVMPSLYEGYGMVLAEALARGLPIVCTTGGAAADTAPDTAALKVPPGDVAAFSAALARVLGDAALRRRMADAAWSAGQHLPRWTDTTKTIAETLKRVAEAMT
jgi:glycosyltransferase involved in cell wall biosynthesis